MDERSNTMDKGFRAGARLSWTGIRRMARDFMA